MRGNSLTVEFLKLYVRLNASDKYIASIAWHNAPIYFSHKPAALINLGETEKTYDHIILESIEKHDNRIGIAGITDAVLNRKKPFFGELNAVLFSGTNNSYQLFCYNPERVRAICRDYGVKCFLMNLGYKSLEPEDCIKRLKYRFDSGCGFPHEIGIFLGYPLNDVKAFILNKGRNYLISGYWKVYSNLSGALNVFTDYDNARKQMLEILRQLLQ